VPVVFDPLETVALAEFAPEVTLAAKDCPPEIAENYLRHAAIDLAERSQAVVRALYVHVQACVNDYLLELPTCERIVSIQQICNHDGCTPVVPTSHGPCSLPCPLGCGASLAWFEHPNVVYFSPAPAHDLQDAFRVEVATAPERDACDVDRRYYERYHEAVVHGALARLLMLKGTEWYDPMLARDHRLQFDQQVSAAGMDRLTGGVRGPFRMVPRRIV
jgi:hypothetical protein